LEYKRKLKNTLLPAKVDNIDAGGKLYDHEVTMHQNNRVDDERLWEGRGRSGA